MQNSMCVNNICINSMCITCAQHDIMYTHQSTWCHLQCHAGFHAAQLKGIHLSHAALFWSMYIGMHALECMKYYTHLIYASTVNAISFHSSGAVSTDKLSISHLCTFHIVIVARMVARINTGIWGRGWYTHSDFIILGRNSTFSSTYWDISECCKYAAPDWLLYSLFHCTLPVQRFWYGTGYLHCMRESTLSSWTSHSRNSQQDSEEDLGMAVSQ